MVDDGVEPGLIPNCLGSLLTQNKCSSANIQYLDSLYTLHSILKHKKQQLTLYQPPHNRAAGINNQNSPNSQKSLNSKNMINSRNNINNCKESPLPALMNQINSKIVLDYAKSKYTVSKYY